MHAQEARAALGVHIRGNVLIVDEAHNLVDAVNGAHSASLTAAQLRVAEGQLNGYYQRFRSRLAPGARQGFVVQGLQRQHDITQRQVGAKGISWCANGRIVVGIAV